MLLILYNRRSTSTTDQESLSARFYCNRAAVVVDQGTKVRTLGVLDFLGKTLAFPSVPLKIFSNRDRGDKVACTSPSMIPLEPRKAKAHHHQYSRFSDTLLARIFHLPWVKKNLCNMQSSIYPACEAEHSHKDCSPPGFLHVVHFYHM